jgi:hypothetical protein
LVLLLPALTATTTFYSFGYACQFNIPTPQMYLRNLNMLNLTPFGRLTEFTKLTDKMINEASKDALADTARMLAIQVAHYQRKFGNLPLEDSIALLETKALSEDQAGWIADGLENLAIAIASVKDEEQRPTVQ